MKQLIPEISLGLPVDLSGYLSKLVFGDAREVFVFEQQDVFLDWRGQQRHGQELVDARVAHVEVAGELLDVVDLAAVQKLFDLVGKGKVLEKPGLVLYVLFLRGYSLMSYLDGPVRNYFIGQGLVEQGKPWPSGEWAHGKPGLLQAYGEMLGVSGEQEICRYLDCLSHKKVKGHWQCPCGGGKQIRQCHVAVVRRLQGVLPHRIARQALERLNRYSKR